MLKISKGFTLLETLIALAVFLILSASAGRLLLYTARASERIIAGQGEFEKTRIAMDTLLSNLQMAEEIDLQTDSDGVLKQMTLLEINPEGQPAYYEFRFNKNASPASSAYHRLEFGQNELVSNIASVMIIYSPQNTICVKIITDGTVNPVSELNGFVDVRYKHVTVKK